MTNFKPIAQSSSSPKPVRRVKVHAELVAPLVDISDGDTLKIQTSSQIESWVKSLAPWNDFRPSGANRHVRFFGIDIVEKDQPFGLDAKDHLANMLDRESSVTLTLWDIDQYGRLVCEVYPASFEVTPQYNLNRMMLREGYGVAYRKWLRKAGGRLLEDYVEDENFARRHDVNFWSQSEQDRILPMVWRRNRRHFEKKLRSQGREPRNPVANPALQRP